MAVNRDKIITSAEKLVAKGKIEPAIKEYERLLEDNANDVNTLNRIGDLWVRINRTDEAVRVFTRIGDYYAKDGFFLKAIAIYKKINKLDPSKLDIYGKLADLYAKQGLAMEAKSQYQILADYHLKHGDPNNALLTYRKISELDPNSINVHVKLADLYSQNNRTDEALKEYDRVGKMLLKRGMLDEAVQVFKKALKIDSSNLDLAESLVGALIEAKDYQNALQILETSLEVNRTSPRLAALAGRAHIARGDLGSAATALQDGLAQSADDPALRELLAEVYLKQGRTDQALALVAPLVDAAAARSDGRSAVDLLNRILRTDATHAGALEKLVAVYTRLNEQTNILAAMNSLAEAHMARNDFGRAESVLRELVRREPENAQHRDKLAFVQQQAGRPGASPPSAPPAAPPEIPSFDEASTLSFTPSESERRAFGEIDVPEVEIDFGAQQHAETPSRTAAPSAPERFDIQTDEVDDIDFITEHMTEADVFAKYGLTDRAIEHLQMILERSPRHAGALERLLRIQMDEGDSEGVARTARAYISGLRQKDEQEAADTIQQSVIERGFEVEADQPPAFAPGPVEAPQAAREFQPDAVAAEPAPAADDMEIEFDLDAIPFEDIPVVRPPQIEQSIEQSVEEIEEIDEMQEVAAEAEPFYGNEAERQPADWDAFLTEAPAVEELGEIDFYIEQDLYDEARKRIGELIARYPSNRDLVERLDLVEARTLPSDASGAAEAEGATPPPLTFDFEPSSADLGASTQPSAELDIDALIAEEIAPAAPAFEEQPAPGARDAEPPSQSAFSAADIENELLAAIPDDDEEMIAAAPAPAPGAATRAPATDEGNLFADEDDFFDLAAELEEELEEEEQQVLSLSEEEQSLEQIFREFKKGVEQQLDSEDYDTHYNLGIAYKEMGLIDEAIGEFQLASKDPKRTIECCSMLGLCFLEKGMPQLAIKWYRKGLETPEISEEEHMGLLYDLGSTYMEIGDTTSAHKSFLEVYGINTNYRDIVERIRQVENVRP
ncbi:MAG TPA: tetratricopeptide repeat protein [Thermoanaerobaculia bacterium]|nr:tetratricopeptide repeat protein [Thermoanaerobaculia bacterium]